MHKHRERHAAAPKAASGHTTRPHPDPIDDSKVDLTVDAIQANGARSKVDIRLSALSDEKRGIVQSALQRARENLAASVVLLIKGNTPVSLTEQLARIALGQLRGSIDTGAPERSKRVGIFFDAKCSGEATRRPHLRVPPHCRGATRH